jgi:Tol biopolymer transport system component
MLVCGVPGLSCCAVPHGPTEQYHSRNRPLSFLLFISFLLGAVVPGLAYDTTERVSVSSAGAEGDSASHYPSISADGRYVAFWSSATNLVEGDTNDCIDVFVRDRESGATERVSVSSAGAQGNSGSNYPSISADGRYVAFQSQATNLVEDDDNATWDVFVRDRLTGGTERVSLSSTEVEGNGESGAPSISADGRYVAFHSLAGNLVAGDDNGYYDIFARHRLSGTTERVSVSTAGAQANRGSFNPSISADGRYVAFESRAGNLVAGDDNDCYDVFVHDQQTGATERVSVTSAGEQGDSDSYDASITADGRFVVLQSDATNLVVGDTNADCDVFVHDQQTGVTERVSLSSAEAEGNANSEQPCISGDGGYVPFYSDATNLVAGDSNGTRDIFVRDRLAGTTERVSLSSTGAEANDSSEYASISADGMHVAFQSNAANLVPGDNNSSPDIFVRGPAPLPQVLLEVHPNERGPGPTAVNRFPGLDYWTWPALVSGSAYTWKEYDFDGSASLWIQVCAQNFSAFQNSQNASLPQEDLLKLTIDGIVPSDFWGIQSGAAGSYQWKGSAEKGKRVTLEFLPAGLTPGLHQLVLQAQMSPAIYWVKVHDLEPRYAGQD